MIHRQSQELANFTQWFLSHKDKWSQNPTLFTTEKSVTELVIIDGSAVTLEQIESELTTMVLDGMVMSEQ